jgi:CarD family transcriptional regulator
MEIAGKVQKFYSLKVLDSEMTIRVPVEKAEQVGLRPVVREGQIREVFDILREKDVHVDKQTWNRRYRGFMEKIKTGSLFEVAEVFRDLYRLKHTKTLSFGERRMLDTAKNLIVKELSVAKKTTELKVEKEIERLFA